MLVGSFECFIGRGVVVSWLSGRRREIQDNMTFITPTNQSHQLPNFSSHSHVILHLIPYITNPFHLSTLNIHRNPSYVILSISTPTAFQFVQPTLTPTFYCLILSPVSPATSQTLSSRSSPPIGETVSYRNFYLHSNGNLVLPFSSPNPPTPVSATSRYTTLQLF